MPPAAIGSTFGSNELRPFFIFTFFYKSKQKNLRNRQSGKRMEAPNDVTQRAASKLIFMFSRKKRKRIFFSAEQVTSRQPVVKGYRNCNHGNHFGGQNWWRHMLPTVEAKINRTENYAVINTWWWFSWFSNKSLSLSNRSSLILRWR